MPHATLEGANLGASSVAMDDCRSALRDEDGRYPVGLGIALASVRETYAAAIWSLLGAADIGRKRRERQQVATGLRVKLQ